MYNKKVKYRQQKKIWSLLFFFCLTHFCLISPTWAGDPESAEYSVETDRLFWFIQISDIHIGDSGSKDDDNLTWVVTEAKDTIDPEFIVASGDLTDSTNGGGTPDGPHVSEWDDYNTIVATAGMTPDFYYDIPGNHDHYGDKDFDLYLDYAIQVIATDSMQVSWRKDFAFGSYHFLGINTAGNDGANFNILPPDFGDNAGLDTAELTFIESELDNNNDVDLSLIFGHHPLPQRPTGDFDDTYIGYGGKTFIQLMETYGVSVYSYGHTHEYRKALLSTDNSEGVFDLNIAPLGKDPEGSPYSYQLFAIDCNGISTVQQRVNTWPAVLITAPTDVKLGRDANPYTYSVNDLNPKPIRALVFDTAAVTNVQFRIDGGDWHPMTNVIGPLYNALWDEPSILDGEHTLEVQAIGSTTRSHTITVGVADTSSSKSGGNGGGGGGCFIGVLE